MTAAKGASPTPDGALSTGQNVRSTTADSGASRPVAETAAAENPKPYEPDAHGIGCTARAFEAYLANGTVER